MNDASAYDEDPIAFEPELTPAEEAFGDAMASHPVLPRASFRGELDRHIGAQDSGIGSRPQTLWRSVALLAAGALALFAVALVIALS